MSKLTSNDGICIDDFDVEWGLDELEASAVGDYYGNFDGNDGIVAPDSEHTQWNGNLLTLRDAEGQALATYEFALDMRRLTV